MSKIDSLDIGSIIVCTRHGGEVALSCRMKKEKSRVCDECTAAYKKAYAQARRSAIRDRKISDGDWLNRSSLDNEVWRSIPGFSGYEASSHGRIRSLDRIDSIDRIAFGRVLSPYVNSRGYFHVRIRGDLEKLAHTISVHSLVALTFHGPRPALHAVAHNDGCPGNNSPSNLRYATHKENESDKTIHGTKFFASGALNGHAKIDESAVIRIRNLLASGTPSKEIQSEYGISQSAVSLIKARKTWKHI